MNRYSVIYAAALLLSGVLLGAATSFLVTRHVGARLGDRLQLLAILTQPLAIIAAMGTMLITLYIGTEQTQQTKQQFTRVHLDGLLTPQRKAAIGDANTLGSFLVSVQAIGMDMTNMSMSTDGASKIAHLAYRVGTELDLYLEYFREIRRCLDSDVCDAALVRDTLCPDVSLMEKIDSDLHKNGVIYRSLRVTFPTADEVDFEHPKRLSTGIDDILIDSGFGRVCGR